VWDSALLALVCLFFMTLRWKKMDSLMWLDPAHWLNEISRLARGELPYRDFSFQYPPFVAFLYGWLLRLFGIRFTTVQVITNVVDIVAIACCYALIRKLLPRSLHLAVAGCLVAVCATSLMNFNVFSYVTYSPSLQTGAAGLLLLLFALLSGLRERNLGPAAWVLAACGGYIAVLSKPESALASLCVIGLFALITRRPWLALRILAVAFVPALGAYTALANAVGFANLRAGITGYGLATAFCPWWPTGVGVLGLLAALGEAVAVATVLTLPKRRSFGTEYGPRYRALLWAAPLGGLIFLTYIAYQNRYALTDPTLAPAEVARRVLPYLIYSTPVLEPVLMVSIVTFLYLAWRVLWTQDARPGDAELLLVVTVPVVMGARSLFSTTQNIYPEVAAICYPFLLVLGPYFLWRFLNSAAGPRYAVVVVAVLTIGYAVIRTAGGWSGMLSGRSYGTLHTQSGTVRLLNYDIDSRVYAYVMAHTSSDDYVLDLPYGGGLNFANGRRCPIFNVQLFGLGVPPYYEQLDLELIRRRPPRLVIGQDEPHLGTYWGFGQKGDRACPCPRLVWAPDQQVWDPNHVLPVVKYIEEHYQPVEKIGNKVIWTRQTPSS